MLQKLCGASENTPVQLLSMSVIFIKNLKASLGMHNSLFGYNSTYKLNCPLPHNEDHIIQSRNCNVVINEPNMVRECNIFTLIPMQPLYYKIFFCTNFPTPQLEMCWT